MKPSSLTFAGFNPTSSMHSRIAVLDGSLPSASIPPSGDFNDIGFDRVSILLDQMTIALSINR